MKRLALFSLFLAFFIFPGCDKKNEPTPPPSPPPRPTPTPAPPSEYKVIHVERGGDLAVDVYYRKNIRRKKIDTSKDAKCPEALDESIVVNEAKLLKDVVVYLDIHEGKGPERRMSPVLDQDG